MLKLSWRVAFAEQLRPGPGRSCALAAVVCLLAVALLAAACANDESLSGPQQGRRQLLSPPTPTPTATRTPEPTATPTPTPTPLPAQAVGLLPGGQLFFSVARDAEPGRSLWRLDTAGELALTAAHVAPGGWDCSGGEAALCVVAAVDGQVTTVQPNGAVQALLDLITAAPTAGITTTAISSAGPPGVGITATATISASAALTLTAEAAPPALTVAMPVTLTAAAVQIAPDARRVAVAAADRVLLYDLQGAELAATAWITGAAALQWSPDAAALVVTAQGADWHELTLWQVDKAVLRPLARVAHISAVAWSRQGTSLAFAARHGPGLNDVFVYSLRDGELRNLTELALRSPQQAPRGLMAAWRPVWETDETSLTYVRGNPADPATQQVVRQPLQTGQYDVLRPLAEEGVLGLVPSSDGQFQARLMARDGVQAVQLRPTAGGDWQDLALATLADVQSLQWDPPAADGSHRYLMVVRPQGLTLIDTWTGQAQDLTTTCPQCRIEQVLWRP